MKAVKYLGVVIVICTLCTIASFVSVAAAKDDDVIKVGYHEIYTDMIDDIDNEHYRGYGYEVFQKIEELSDLKFEFVPVEGSLIDAVNSGIVDVAGLSVSTDERRERVLYSNTPYSKSYVALMTNDMDIRYNTPESMDGKTVATYEDNYAQQYLDNYCEQNGISVEYIYGDVNNYGNLDADFYITYSEDRNSQWHNNVLNLGVFNLYLITSYENEALMEQLDMYFSQIVYTEGNFFWELEEKYLSDNLEINHRSLTQNEIKILQSRPLEVGYIQDYQPISFMNEQGEPDGAMVETLNMLAEQYDFEINYHPYSLTEDAQAHEDFDILLTIYGDGAHEEEYYDVTESYYYIPMYAQIHLDAHQNSVTFRDMMENAPKIGTLPYQSIDYDSLLKEFPDNEIVFYNEWNELLDDFIEEKLDMIIHTESGLGYTDLYMEGVDKVVMHTDIQNPMRLFVSKDISGVYVPIFNIMLDRVSEREYESILITNSNVYYPERSIFDFILEYWYYFAIGIIAGLAIFAGYEYKKQKEKQEALAIAYNTDALTGLMALHRFDVVMNETLAKARPKEYELISFDVDVFKTINTHFSNERGTNVILAISEQLKTVFKDTSAIICRRTSDQFLILRRVDDGGPMRQIYSNDILPSIREILGDKYNISMSFGNVIISKCGEKATTIVGQADTARVQGKHSHKTTFITFDEKMQKIYDDKINITFRMEQALKDNEFFVQYQPKVNFSTMKVDGAEALVRWKPKLGDTIYPDSFIPVFEDNGFISTLDLFVLEETCKFINTNYKQVKIPRISVNLSAHTVLSDDVVNRISNIIDLHKIHPREIELELTESAIEANASMFLLRVNQLKKLGFSIAIDDFGAGVSSLNRLSAIEADVLKLDKAFFDLKEQGGKSTTIVADVVTMARHLDMKVVAEGVETAAQALWLRGIKCDYAQGYYFAKPIGKDEFKELLASDKAFTI